jgi:hypothetical protein
MLSLHIKEKHPELVGSEEKDNKQARDYWIDE